MLPRWTLWITVSLCMIWLAAQPVVATESHLPDYLGSLAPDDLVPGGERFGEVEGTPPVAQVYAGEEIVGLVFLTTDMVASIGYSGKPIHTVVGFDTTGTITGAKLVEHHEPIVLIGIPESRITAVLDGYLGRSVETLFRQSVTEREVDIVSGATVTIMVMDDSIVRAGVKVARAYGLGGMASPVAAQGPRLVVNPEQSEVRDWQALLGDGSVRRLQLSLEDINQAFAQTGDAKAVARPEEGEPGEIFLDFYAALASVPTIGLSLLGEDEYRNLSQRLERDGGHAILLAGRGRYSYKGSGFVRGGVFDRFQLVQGDDSVRFRDRQYKRLRRVLAAGTPEDLIEVGLFYIPEAADLDPAEEWRLELLVHRAIGPTSKVFLDFRLPYRLPQGYLVAEAMPEPVAVATMDAAEPEMSATPLWHRIWRDKAVMVGGLLVALAVLTAIFFFQGYFAARPVLTDRLRIAFMLFTLVGIGFVANAQLSVVNVMTFFNALITGFQWDYFLMDPLIFILWGSVAAAMLFWGRGAYCGWLCPFGAFQELLNRAAKIFKVPQIEVPWAVHERLWPIKYILFLGLFGAALYSLAVAEQLAEVEPFKTAIILKFQRSWPFVLYAVLLLAAGLLIERFYCRYLCPLGAALAIPGRLRMFDWLKRYRDCGSTCQRCANECMVQAIHPEGQINPNECLYCLHCQVLYCDDERCPVVTRQRLKRQRRTKLASPSMRGAPAPAANPSPPE